jgi:hypothetical protein
LGLENGLIIDLDISSPFEHVVTITVHKGDIPGYITKALEELGKDAVIPGFRKGRASREGIRAHFGEKRVHEVAAEMLARNAFNQVLNSFEKKPITPPEFDLPELIPGKDYTFTASYYIQPPDPQTIAKEIAEAHLSGHPYHGQIPPQHTPQIHTPGLNPFQHQPLENVPGSIIKSKITHGPVPEPIDPTTDLFGPPEPTVTDIYSSDELIQSPNVIPKPPLTPKVTEEKEDNP